MASWTATISSRLLRRAVLGIIGISVVNYAAHSRVACHEKFGPHNMVSSNKKKLEKDVEILDCLGIFVPPVNVANL